jgi:hypothetical protein
MESLRQSQDWENRNPSGHPVNSRLQLLKNCSSEVACPHLSARAYQRAPHATVAQLFCTKTTLRTPPRHYSPFFPFTLQSSLQTPYSHEPCNIHQASSLYERTCNNWQYVINGWEKKWFQGRLTSSCWTNIVYLLLTREDTCPLPFVSKFIWKSSARFHLCISTFILLTNVNNALNFKVKTWFQ